MSNFGSRLARLVLVALVGLCLPAPSVQAQMEDKAVLLIVNLPANAKLYIDDVATNSTGETRRFISDKVPAGKKYSYKLKGVWTGPDGKEVVKETRFVVTPGIENTIDLTKAADIPKPVAKLTLQVADSLPADAGTKKTLKVKITRENTKDPVKVTVAGLPAGATANELTLPADKSEGDLEITLPKDAKDGESALSIKAESPATKAEAKVKMTVKAAPPPPPPAKLGLEVPGTILLEAGAKKLIPIRIKRENFKGPVKLTFAGLPENVKLPEMVFPEDKNEAQLEINLPKEAKAGMVTVKVKAEGGNTTAETESKVTIKEAAAPPPPPPAKLGLEMPGTIEIKAGGTTPVTVKTKRENFKGPVKLVLAGLPAGVTAGEVIVAEDKNEATVELKAAKDAPAATADVTLKGDASAKAEGKFKLTVKPADAPKEAPKETPKEAPKEAPKDAPKPPEAKPKGN